MTSGGRSTTREDTGQLTGHKILCKHLHVTGFVEDPTSRFCGREEESSPYLLCHYRPTPWQESFDKFWVGFPTLEEIKYCHHNKIRLDNKSKQHTKRKIDTDIGK